MTSLQKDLPQGGSIISADIFLFPFSDGKYEFLVFMMNFNDCGCSCIRAIKTASEECFFQICEIAVDELWESWH